MKNKIDDFRNLMLSQLLKLSECADEELDKEISRSASMVQVAEVIIDSARAESEFLSLIAGGVTGTSFITNNPKVISNGAQD